MRKKAGEAVPRRRLRHRLPTSLRRHWKWPVALAAFAAIVIATIGSMTIRPLITGDERVIRSSITENIAGTVDLFDDSVPHEVAVTMTDVEYREMLDAFVDNGEKKWVTGSVTIDGTLISDVGIRLKGNSTLMSLRGDRQGPGGGERGDAENGRQPPAGFQPPDGMEPPDGTAATEEEQPTRQEGEQPTRQEGQGMPMGGGPGGMVSLSADDPTSLPLLLRFDKEISGRAYQGMTQLSVRPGSPVLNEAMALSLTAETGQPTQRYAYTVYSVNDSATATRLLLEYPDAGYADSLMDSDGYLFKADASSRLEYVDDDQSSYSDQFKQINSQGNGNLQPIIRFLKWLKDADDAEFDAHLAEWVDVDSFAKYLATQNLLSNSDDMSGPGQNYYLWYDLATKKISVISWDLNLAMQGAATAGPHDSISMGGGGPRAQNDQAQTDRTQTDGERPAPEGDRAGGPGGMRGGNALKERFLDSEKFTELYDTDYWELYDEIYGDADGESAAQRTLDRLSSSIPLSDGLTAAERTDAVASMQTWIDQRAQSLAATRKS